MKTRVETIKKRFGGLNRAEISRDELKINLDELLIQISFLQHERLIHLLVTLFFATLFLLFFVMMYLSSELMMIILCLVVGVLELFYIKHYYHLENGVQKLYEIYDELRTDFTSL